MIERASAVAAGERRWRPRLRSILLLTYILVLAVPLGGVSLLRLYDSMLIRQTEAELIVQGAAVAALYRAERQALPGDGAELLKPEQDSLAVDDGEHFKPAIASLDLARHRVLEPIPPALPAPRTADPLALRAGRSVEPILLELQRTSLAGLRLVDANGIVVATSGTELGLSLAHRPEVAAALAGLRSSVLRRRDLNGSTPPLGSISRGTRLRVVVGFPIAREDEILGAVVLARTPMSVRQAIYRDRRYFLTGVAVTVAAITLLAWLTGAALGRPLRDLILQTERVRRGETDAAVPLQRPVTLEVEQISHAVAEMAAALVERADYIAAFAANVSHEFKTPLTSIHGTVELLSDHLDEMTADEQRRFLTMLEKDAARLERLVDRLLELARADVIRPGDGRVKVASMLESVAARYRALGLDLQLDFQLDPQKGLSDFRDASVAISPEALDSILANLLENARQHGGEAVRVTLHAEARGDRMHFEVEDDGPGISEANRDRVFDRFFTTRRADGGSGLGLAIVRALAEAHGGEIYFRCGPSKTVFTVDLPLAKPSRKLVF